MFNFRIKENQNKIITNLTNIDLSNDEISVLELGLKHGLLTRPKELKMIPIVENVWEQIQNQGVLKNDHISKVSAIAALKSFTYNYLDLDVKQLISGSKTIKTLRKMKDKCLIRKPDKGQGIVLVNRDDYNDSLENLFNDTSKFQLLDHDPYIRNLSTVQSYLNMLHNRQEIILEHKNAMRPKLDEHKLDEHTDYHKQIKINTIFHHFTR